ncbi:CGNR zinc finger domain-containing protein [Lentzea chajnantorensis]
MRFGDYADPVVTLAEDVVNSYRHSVGVDDLSPAVLTSLARARGWTGADASPADVVAVRSLRSPLRAVFEAHSVAAANELVASSGLVPELVEHDGLSWHLHLTGAVALPAWVAGQAAFALLAVVEQGGVSRLHRCAGPDCHAVFVDLSRNQSRVFCSPAVCGNRVHVKAHRARKAVSPRSRGSA